MKNGKGALSPTAGGRAIMAGLALVLAVTAAGCAPGPQRLTTGPIIEFDYYYASNCHLCREFLDVTVPKLEQRLGARLSAITHDVLVADNLHAFSARLKKLGITPVDLPAVVIGETVLQGKARIDAGLETELKKALAARADRSPARHGDTLSGDSSAGDAVSPDAAEKNAVNAERLAFIPVLLAGLADGVNPCVFSTLIFLLAYLTYAGKTRKQILLIGICYSATVFVSYFLIGLGIFRIIQALSFFGVVSQILNIVLIGVLFLFAGLSLYDFIMIRQGHQERIKLQLPDFFKNRIRKTIRAQATSATIVLSAAILGFLVSVFELACTGQIYFPTIAALVQTRKHISDFLYLLVYNLGFIIPLVIVFILTYTGLSSERLTEYFKKHMGTVKLVIAVLFFLAAAFMLAYAYGPYLFS